MSDQLGPLPEPADDYWCLYTADQMRAYAAAEVAKERERWIALCKDFAADTNPPHKNFEDTYCDGWLDACNEIMWKGQA